MNLADYLSELLAQQDEVSIPGLGCFVRTRVNAYYNSSEGRFYPPHHEVNFVGQPKEDDTFAQYVADKKNISLASSKYFIEKFVAKLREDASRGKYLFADLGTFRSDLDQLTFKPNDKIHADPAFYGYAAVDIHRLNQPLPSSGQRGAGLPQPVNTSSLVQPTAPEAATEPAVMLSHQPQYYEEEVEQKRGTSVWLIILIVLLVMAAAFFGVYKFYPSLFEKAKTEFNKITGKTAAAPAVIRRKIAADTVKKSLPLSDTASKSVTSSMLADTAVSRHYEVLADDLQYLEQANAAVKQLKAKGYDAHIDLTAIGPRIKVVIGSYPSYDAADSAEKALVKTGIIKKHYYPLEIRP